MRRIQFALGAAGIAMLCLGTVACVKGTCQCALSVAASKFAYVMLQFDTIAAFTINASTGGLTPVAGSPFGGSISPLYGAADPAGKFLYAVVPGTGNVYGFSIDQTTGALTAVPGSPFSLRASEPDVPIVDPSGSFLYITHLDSCGDDCKGAISAFKIGPDGSLTEIAGSPYTTDYGTMGIAVHPSGQFVFAVNGKNCCRTSVTVSVFRADATSGALTQITGSPFPAGESIPLFAAVHPNGKFLYVTEQNLPVGGGAIGGVATFSIDPTSGALAPISGFFTNAGVDPLGIDVDAIDNLLFVANSGDASAAPPADGSISAYRMDGTTGALTNVQGSPFTTKGSNPFQPAVDRSCRFLYVTNNNPGLGTAADYVLGFQIDPLTAALTAAPGSPFATPSGGPPQGIVLTPHRAATSTGP